MHESAAKGYGREIDTSASLNFVQLFFTFFLRCAKAFAKGLNVWLSHIIEVELNLLPQRKYLFGFCNLTDSMKLKRQETQIAGNMSDFVFIFVR